MPCAAPTGVAPLPRRVAACRLACSCIEPAFVVVACHLRGHDLCRCCLQTNGFDCGLWVRMFALLVLDTFPAHMSPSILLALRGAHVCTLLDKCC